MAALSLASFAPPLAMNTLVTAFGRLTDCPSLSFRLATNDRLKRGKPPTLGQSEPGNVIALAVLILSAVWLLFGFGYWASPDEPSAANALWIAMGIDTAVLAFGVVAISLAHRRKYPWFLAIVFIAAPISHFTIPFFGASRIVVFGLPFAAVALAALVEYLRLLFRPSPAMHALRRRLLIGCLGYGFLWALTGIVGTRQVAQQLRALSHIDDSYTPIACAEIPRTAPDHGWGCCTVSYAPFIVIAQYAYYDRGFSTGDAAVFLWCGRPWLIMSWPWGHGWIT